MKNMFVFEFANRTSKRLNNIMRRKENNYFLWCGNRRSVFAVQFLTNATWVPAQLL